MKTGRPPKHTEVKVLEGTYRADRVTPNVAEPMRLANVPDPPEGLSNAAQVEWTVVATWLQGIGQLATTDISLLAEYCNEIAEYWEFDKIVKKQGRLLAFKDKDGRPTRVVLNPAIAGRSASLSNAMRLGGQFGLTPVMRSRIQNNTPQKAKSRLELLKEKRR